MSVKHLALTQKPLEALLPCAHFMADVRQRELAAAPPCRVGRVGAGRRLQARVIVLAIFAIAVCACSPPPEKEVVLLPYPDDAAAVTWDGWAGAFVRDYCVECHQPSAPCGGSGCHATGDPALWDFHDKTQVTSRAETIRCGVAVTQDPSWNCSGTSAKKFPVVGDTPFPTDEQRGIVVDWIEAGCP